MAIFIVFYYYIYLFFYFAHIIAIFHTTPPRYFARFRRYIFVNKYDKYTLLSFFNFATINEQI